MLGLCLVGTRSACKKVCEKFHVLSHFGAAAGTPVSTGSLTHGSIRCRINPAFQSGGKTIHGNGSLRAAVSS
jgi:hypothetical protein